MSELEYLYDTKIALWRDMPYLKALEFKNSLADKVVTKILVQHYTQRDEPRLRAVLKAIKFNENRMRE
ncbi:MAG: hypothetical protein NTW78_04080 [Campylobacterales bacterium]|nr:hypothetical protein [Campylobacterales bacterium]